MAIMWKKDNSEIVRAQCTDCGVTYYQNNEWDMANLDSHTCAGKGA